MPNPYGRPKGTFKEIKKEQFEVLCQIQCTEVEICAVLGVDHKTLNRWCKEQYGRVFSQVYDERRAEGRMSLRRKQFKLAMDGNATMLIWLGKNVLGQKDKVEETHEIKMDPKVQFVWNQMGGDTTRWLDQKPIDLEQKDNTWQANPAIPVKLPEESGETN